MDLSVRLWDITALSELSAIKVPRRRRLSVPTPLTMTHTTRRMQGGHSEQIQSVVFNYDGGVMATSAKDQRIRLWDPRTGAKIDETVGHETPKASRLAWLGNSTRILSTGFHKSSEREFMIFDTRNFSKPLTSSLIGTHTTHTARHAPHDTRHTTRHTLMVVMAGTGSGVFEPFFDEDIGVVYLMANGDSSVKFWEVSEEAPYAHYLTENLSTRQQASVARLPKTACDVRNVRAAPPSLSVVLRVRSCVLRVLCAVVRVRSYECVGCAG
jgi:WD40 repeat protein